MGGRGAMLGDAETGLAFLGWLIPVRIGWILSGMLRFSTMRALLAAASMEVRSISIGRRSATGLGPAGLTRASSSLLLLSTSPEKDMRTVDVISLPRPSLNPAPRLSLCPTLHPNPFSRPLLPSLKLNECCKERRNEIDRRNLQTVTPCHTSGAGMRKRRHSQAVASC